MRQYYIVLITLFALISCNKNEVLNDNTNQPNRQKVTERMESISTYDGMLVFSCFKDFDATLHKVAEMSDRERLNWEESIGFQSFGRLADEFYEAIDIEKFTNAKEIFNYFDANSDKLFYEIEKEEVTLSVQKLCDPERWLMNVDRMYIVEGTVFKFFSNDMVVATKQKDKENTELLKKATDLDLEKLMKDPNFVCYLGAEGPSYAPTGPMQPPLPTQPSKPNGALMKKELKVEKDKYRSRLILETTVKSHWSFANGITDYYARDTYTLVNEHHVRWLGFLWYYWKNTEAQTKGNISMSNRHCVFNYENWRYEEFNAPCSFNYINSKIKKETKFMDLSLQRQDHNIEPKKPWAYIIGYNVSLTIDNGRNMNFNY